MSLRQPPDKQPKEIGWHLENTKVLRKITPRTKFNTSTSRGAFHHQSIGVSPVVAGEAETPHGGVLKSKLVPSLYVLSKSSARSRWNVWIPHRGGKSDLNLLEPLNVQEAVDTIREGTNRKICGSHPVKDLSRIWSRRHMSKCFARCWSALITILSLFSLLYCGWINIHASLSPSFKWVSLRKDSYITRREQGKEGDACWGSIPLRTSSPWYLGISPPGINRLISLILRHLSETGKPQTPNTPIS